MAHRNCSAIARQIRTGEYGQLDRAATVARIIRSGLERLAPEGFRIVWQGQWRHRGRLGICRPVAVQAAWLDEVWGDNGPYAEWRFDQSECFTVWQTDSGEVFPSAV